MTREPVSEHYDSGPLGPRVTAAAAAVDRPGVSFEAFAPIDDRERQGFAVGRAKRQGLAVGRAKRQGLAVGRAKRQGFAVGRDDVEDRQSATGGRR